MLDLSLLRNSTFTTLLVAVALLPASLTTFAVSIAVGRVMDKASPRLLVGTGMLIVAAGALAQAVIGAGSGWAVVLPGLFLVGLGAGLVLGPLSAAAMAAVPGPRAGMAAGAVNTFRQLGYAFGIAVLGAVFHAGLAHTAGEDLAGQLGGGQAAEAMARGSDLALLVHRAYAHALDLTFLVAAGFGLVGGIAVLLFVRQRRDRARPTRDRPLADAAKPR
jgi:MFS family permease